MSSFAFKRSRTLVLGLASATLAEDTVKALDKFSVPATEKGEVMNMLGSLKGDVVNH